MTGVQLRRRTLPPSLTLPPPAETCSMLALTRLRVLCGFVLLVAIASTGLTADAAERQKPKKGEKPTPTKKPYDAVKKAPTAVGFLAAGTKLTAEELASHIDKVIGKKLAAEKVTASPLT